MQTFGANRELCPIIGGVEAYGTASYALDSAYVHLVSGDALAFLFVALGSKLYGASVCVGAKTGSPAQIEASLHGYNAGIPAAATIVSANLDVTGAGSNTRLEIDFGAGGLTVAGTQYFLVLKDANGSGADFITLKYSAGARHIEDNRDESIAPFSSSNGCSTLSALARVSCCTLDFGTADDGRLLVLGEPYDDAIGGYVSNQLARGVLLDWRDLPDTLVSAVAWYGHSTHDHLHVYEDDTAPGGSAIFSQALSGDVGARGYVPTPGLRLRFGHRYRVVLTASGNTTYPLVLKIHDTAGDLAHVLACRTLGNRFHATQDDGAGGWNDWPNYSPRMALFLEGWDARPQPGIFAGAF